MSVLTPAPAGPDTRPINERVAATVHKRRELLERAVRAIHERTYFSAFPESPSPRVYGETAADQGGQAFESLLNRRFDLGQPATARWRRWHTPTSSRPASRCGPTGRSRRARASRCG